MEVVAQAGDDLVRQVRLQRALGDGHLLPGPFETARAGRCRCGVQGVDHEVQQLADLGLEFVALGVVALIPSPGSRWSFTMTRGDRERERRTHTHLALNPDPPTVEFHKLAAQGQS